MDEQLILTGLPLRLNPSLQRSVPSKGISVLGRVGGGEQLTLSDRQYEVLRAFLNPATVPDVLRVLILRRAAIPLREFYELVLKAHRAGVLISEVSTEPPPAARWRWPRLPESVFPIPAFAAVVVVLVWLGLHGLPVSTDWRQAWPYWAGGWLLAGLSLMLGDVLAAGVLSRLRDSAPRLRWKWLSPFPRWVVDLREARSLLRGERVGLATARLFPLSVLALGLATRTQGDWRHLALVPLVALVFELRPFGTGSLIHVLSALFQGALLDTQHSLLFSLNRRWKVRLRAALARLNPLQLFVHLLLASAWSFLLVSLALRAAQSSLRQVYSDAEYWRRAGELFAGWLVIMLALWILPPVFRRGRRTVRRRTSRLRDFLRHWSADVSFVASHPQVLRLMAASPAFRRLDAANRLALVAGGEVRRIAAWKSYGGDDSPVPLGLILSGRVAVYRALPGGPMQRVATYVEGDVLGSEPWSDSEGGQVSIRTLVPLVLLEWAPQFFGERVIAELGPQVACDLFVKVPFLRGLGLCAGWHQQSMVRFAQIARFSVFEHGHAVLAEGEAVLWFFVLYSGGASTRKKSGSRAWLAPGDFFGEISLMRQDVATADVRTEGPTRCLLVHRPEFLRFMTHNPIAALEVERVSSARFGRAVFPYQR